MTLLAWVVVAGGFAAAALALAWSVGPRARRPGWLVLASVAGSVAIVEILIQADALSTATGSTIVFFILVAAVSLATWWASRRARGAS